MFEAAATTAAEPEIAKLAAAFMPSLRRQRATAQALHARVESSASNGPVIRRADTRQDR